MMTNNIRLYAAVCNVNAEDMVKHLQSDGLAREQFESWKQQNNFAGREFTSEANTNETLKADREAATARIQARRNSAK
jgi:hypothetical protein